MTMRASSTLPIGLGTAALALLAWDASGLDLALAAWSGSGAGFPLRDDWWLTAVLHEGGRLLSWAVALLLCLAVWWPVGALRRLSLPERVQLAGTPLLAVAVVNLLKRASGASCPWDLAQFGGVAQPLSHWVAYLRPDGGSGHCFPAGHASAGFAFVGSWLVLRRHVPGLARAALTVSVLAGAAMGIAQQLRGAHFASHTLWTLWLCVLTATAVDVAVRSQNGGGAAA